MARDPRYDILFEPVRDRAEDARNRFYQAPHCTASAARSRWRRPPSAAMKAEGGWAAACTEYCSIRPESDDSASRLRAGCGTTRIRDLWR